MSVNQINKVVNSYAKCTGKSNEDAWIVIVQTISNYDDLRKEKGVVVWTDEDEHMISLARRG